MAATWSNESKSVANAARCTLANGGYLRLYTAGYAILVAELPLPNPCFGGDVNGVAVSNTISPVAAIAAGTIAVCRILKSDGTSVIVEGTCSLSGGGGDITLSALAVSIGQTVEVNPITFRQPS